MSRLPSNSTRSHSDQAMTLHESSEHDSAQTANNVQVHADPQEIYTIDSEKDEDVTGDTEKIEALPSYIDENPDTTSKETTENFSTSAQSNFLTLLKDYIQEPKPVEMHREETSSLNYPRSGESEKRGIRKQIHCLSEHSHSRWNIVVKILLHQAHHRFI